MKKYVKRPVEIEAVQVTAENIYEVLEQANGIMPPDKKIRLAFSKDEEWTVIGLIIPTKEGEMLCSIGDFLIKEPFPTDDRMFYPCKPDMFELTYMEK